jgi:arylsulfatase A-like enzyme
MLINTSCTIFNYQNSIKAFNIKLLFLFFIFFINGLHAQKKLNIIFILSDDQRYNTIHALGNNQIITPNLDSLVKHGTSFTRAHIMGGRQGAICMPSRVMMMTGTYANHLTLDGAIIPDIVKTFPEILRENGYDTYQTGKWHSDKISYNRSFGGGDNIYFGGMHPYEQGGHLQPRLFHYDKAANYPDSLKWTGNQFSSNYYAQAAVDFITSRRENNKPFFLYVAFTSPHDPRTPPKAFEDLYDPKKIDLPPSYRPDPFFDNGELKVRDEELLPHPRTKDAIRKETALYYGMISEMDDKVGKILAALKENHLDSSTLIVFAGDNGLALGNHGLLGKQNLYDHSIRVPLIFVGPSIAANRTSDALVYLPDIAPTILDYANIKPTNTIVSKDLRPVIQGEHKTVRNHVYFLYRDLQRGVRTADNWKLIVYHVNGNYRCELFDLNNDPNELHDLSTNKKYAIKHKELTKLLAEDMVNYGDNLRLSDFIKRN